MFPYCWGGGGKGEKNAQYGNVKCKTENDWVTNTGHISEIKACIPSATSLNLEGGSSSKSEWASVARRDSIVLQNISSFQKKQCEQKRNHKFCSGLQIFKITLWKPGDAKERAKAVFKTLEARARILAAWFGLSAVEVCLRGGLPAHHNLYWEMVVRTQAAETGIWWINLRCKQPSCRQQQNINLLVSGSRLDPLWQKCFLWSTGHQVLCRATCWCAVPCGGGTQPVVSNSFFQLGVLWKWIV